MSHHAVAYLVNSYPMPSQTFIWREIAAVSRQGIPVTRFAIRPNPAPSSPVQHEEAAQTRYLLAGGIKGLLPRAARAALSDPKAAWRGLRLAMQAGGLGHNAVAGSGGRLRHLVYWLEALDLAAELRSRNLRHLHAHFATNSASVAMIAADMAGIGFSFTLHGPEDFDAVAAHAIPLKLARAKFAVMISSFGRAQAYRWLAAKDWPKVHVVHCGIEPWLFPDPTPLPDEGRFNLVAIGRLAEQKGFGLLIEAMALALPDNPALHLTLVGEGPFRPALAEAIRAAQLEDHITLTGWQDEGQVRAHLADAQALVLPSFAEGLPMVVMEAMASARPVIATAIAGVPELVTPDCGMVVPAGDAAALAGAITALARLPHGTRAAMGAAGRARVLARHDIDREAAKLAALFNEATRPARC